MSARWPLTFPAEVWCRDVQPEPTAFRRLAAITLGAALALVALGGAVRATDSGLACPDWPACYGMWLPPIAVDVWLEHSHRLVAGTVGLLIAALLVWVLLRHRHRRDLVAVTVAAAVLVNVQAALGAVVVLRLLQAELVTAHLGMSLVVLACLVLLVRWSSPSTPTSPQSTRGTGTRDDRAIAWSVAGVAALAFAQTVVGGHTTGVNAGLAWRTWPLYDGAVFPPVPDAAHLVHVAHRTGGLVLLGGAMALVVVLRRHRSRQRAAGAWTASHAWLVRGADAVLALTVGQIALGVANLWTLTSPSTVIPHLAVASWIWTLLVALAAHAAWLAPTDSPVPAAGPAPARSEGART